MQRPLLLLAHAQASPIGTSVLSPPAVLKAPLAPPSHDGLLVWAHASSLYSLFLCLRRGNGQGILSGRSNSPNLTRSSPALPTSSGYKRSPSADTSGELVPCA